MDLQEKILQAFQVEFDKNPTWITRSPGRVNIIGEHTDYNDGFVLPMTLGFETQVALQPRTDNLVRVTALDMGEELEFDLDDYSRGEAGWQEYVKGVAWALKEEGYSLKGWEGVFGGDVPIGAGLSSSAALELSLARAFALAGELKWDSRKMALLCQKAENHWVGMNSGIMDQLASACGKRNSAMLIDCRSQTIRHIPLPRGGKFVILDTSTRRGLVESAYNERRAQCEAVACHFGQDALRDIKPDQLLDKAGILELELYRRANHVISENQRVLEAVSALESSDLDKLGTLMNQSHTSLQNDFEVSREELDQIVNIAQHQPGCYGARLTGGGFGGCAVALVEESMVADFQEKVYRKYLRNTGLEPVIYPVDPAEGTSYMEFA
jgi:galactokinase